MTIDWNGELEAYHVDGRVVAVTLDPNHRQPDGPYGYVLSNGLAQKPEQAKYFKPDGTQFWELGTDNGGGRPWRIRNRPTAQSQPTPEQEAVTLVRRMALNDDPHPHYDEARRIAARMEPEVDPIIIQARKIALSHSLPALINGMSSYKVGQGEADDKPYMKAILEALRARNEGETK